MRGTTRRPPYTRVQVVEPHHIYTGFGNVPHKPGTLVDLPPDHAAELIASGHVVPETPPALAESQAS